MGIRTNRVKQKLAAGEVVSIVSGFNDSNLIDQFGPVGCDGIWLESEHGPVDFADISDLSRACDLWGMTSILRINQNEQSVIYRALDCGVQGIVVPHVNTREEAENVVTGGKFAPIGRRGLFVGRQAYGVPDYLKVSNDHSLLVVLIEDIVAVENLDEILEVDHIDVFHVVAHDLAASMGHIGEADHPEVQRTIDESIARIQARGRVAGASTNNSTVAKYTAAGAQFVLCPSASWVGAGAREFMQQAESGRSQRA